MNKSLELKQLENQIRDYYETLFIIMLATFTG